MDRARIKDGYSLIEAPEGPAAQALGRMCAFHGQMGMYVRALTYMMSHGSDGLRQVAEDAVLNANYIKARLMGVMSPAFDGPCMHEALFDDSWLEGTEVTTLDFAKAMIDEGFHPMTMYFFPLVVHGAMLIEPTETEPKAELDRFCEALLKLAAAAKAGDVERFKGKAAVPRAPAPRLNPETLAARKPRLKWTLRDNPRPRGRSRPNNPQAGGLRGGQDFTYPVKITRPCAVILTAWS